MVQLVVSTGDEPAVATADCGGVRDVVALVVGGAAVGVSVGWLRIGERLGALPLARRNHAGWRFYTCEDIDRLRRLGVGERKRRLESSDD